MPKLLFCWSLILFASPLWAQRTCGTQNLDSIRRIKDPTLETKDDFEKWIGNQVLKRSSSTNRAQSTYTIPVVVHVIHNGQPLGTGMNIPTAQIVSQINVLNKDFQRMNTDANQTPSVFQSVAGSLSIQFVLASQDPQGNQTNGIVRVNGGRSSWNLYQDAELKAKSYWPAEQYLNVWVTNLNSYLGYSSFPVSNLPGIDNSSKNRLVDGVIINHQSFGSIDDGAFDLEDQFDKGRTLTHEIGHFLGLRHIWGDSGGCGSTDFVNDTPTQSTNTTGCPSHPRMQCANAVMFQNYMDYTNDRCMNLFTAGQLARVEAVLLNSPRRLSLLTSPGAKPAGNFALDLGIVNAIEPTTLECSGAHTPTITIRNFGTTTITSASIEMKINGVTIETINPVLDLNGLEQVNITFTNYLSAAGELRNFTFTILSVNSVSDEFSGNNVLTVSSKTAANASLPYLETFDTNLNNWDVVNPDDLTGWTQSALVTPGKMLFIDLFNYENEGAVDRIFSPRVDISSAEGLLLKFKYAHVHESGFDGDALYVYAQSGCSDDLTNATRVFAKEGQALGTTPVSGGVFIPSSTQWKTQIIPLQSFVGNQALRLAFVSRNGFGNNIFIDSVQLVGEEITDLVLQQVLEPSPAVCLANVTPKLLLVNQGSVTINGFDVATFRSVVQLASSSFSDVLEPGEETVVALPSIDLNDGQNFFNFVVTPKSATDDIPSNNTVSSLIFKISETQRIPVRENFTKSSWKSVSRSSLNWSTRPTNFGTSGYFNAFADNFSEIGATAMLVSPQLDFSKALGASMFADFSYAVNAPQNEHLSIKVSENCGQTFAYTGFSNFASSFSAAESADSWLPTDADDWQRQYLSLSSFAGQDDILVAIEIVNDNGNNFYVDNIEFFENDDPTPASISESFRVYSNENLTQTYLTFNLEEQQPAEIVVANMMGSSIANIAVDNALNQTLTFQLDVVPGIYIFRVLIGNKWHSVKQFIGY